MRDEVEIDALVRVFFAAFNNRAGAPALDTLPTLFTAGAQIAKCVGDTPEIYSVASFIEPRRALLTGGQLTAFAEAETSGQTTIAGHIAQRLSRYEKSGQLNGAAFRGTGTKTFQFIKTEAGWRIFSVAWDDDPS